MGIFGSNYQREDQFTAEAMRLLRQYTPQQLDQIYDEVEGRIKWIQENERTMTDDQYYHAKQSWDKLVYQYECLKVASQILRQNGGQQRQTFTSSSSGTHLNTGGYGRQQDLGITRVTQRGFNGSSEPQMARSMRPNSGNPRCEMRTVEIEESRPNIGHIDFSRGGNTSQEVQIEQPKLPTKQTETKGAFTMADAVRGSVYPYACLNNKINTDGRTLGFELGDVDVVSNNATLERLQNGALNIKVNSKLAHYAFKNDNGYKSMISGDKIQDEVEPMKNLIETTVELLGAPEAVVEAKITDILIELLRREGIFNIEDTLVKSSPMDNDSWELIDNHIGGFDTEYADLVPLAGLHKNFNCQFKTKAGLYEFMFRLMANGSSVVDGVFAENVFEVTASVKGSGNEFLEFLNKKNFEKFIVTKECNPALYHIIEKSFEALTEEFSQYKKVIKFCPISLRINDETGFEYRILVEEDFMRDAYYVSNVVNAVLVNQGVSDAKGE